MRRIYTISELPAYYFGQTYKIFCFDMLNDTTPLALHIGTSIGDIVTISELNNLYGYFDDDGNFREDKRSYGLFIEFLRSITLNSQDAPCPMSYDIIYAKKCLFVNLHVI